MTRRRLGIGLAVVAALLFAAWALRAPLLTAAGGLLVQASPPARADVIVALRGDEVYFDRAQTAADLYRDGHASLIYVSTALADLGSAQLRAKGLVLRSPQHDIVAILLQRNVPCASIIVETAAPGGGTAGEARRIAATMRARNLSRALVVTSWFHSRRAGWILNDALRPQGGSASVTLAAARSGPANWWAMRYEAIAVLEEFVKIALYAVAGDQDFVDNPPADAAYGAPASDACALRMERS